MLPQKEGRWLFPDGRDCLHQRPRILSTEPSAPLTEVLSFRQLDILCNEEILGKDQPLNCGVVTRWRFKVRLCCEFVWLVSELRSNSPPRGC